MHKNYTFWMNRDRFLEFLRWDLMYLNVLLSRLLGSRVLTKYHPFHLVEPSPLPLFLSYLIFFNLFYLVQSFHNTITFSTHFTLYGFLFSTILIWTFCAYQEEREGHHTIEVQTGFKLGVVLFITSEVMLFLSFFWAYFHFSLNPSTLVGELWPPEGISTLTWYRIPLLNTVILLSSGVTITVAHQLNIWGDNTFKYYYWKWVLSYLILMIEYNVLGRYTYNKSWNIEKYFIPVAVSHWLLFKESSSKASWGEYFGIVKLDSREKPVEITLMELLNFRSLDFLVYDYFAISQNTTLNKFYKYWTNFYKVVQAAFARITYNFSVFSLYFTLFFYFVNKMYKQYEKNGIKGVEFNSVILELKTVVDFCKTVQHIAIYNLKSTDFESSEKVEITTPAERFSSYDRPANYILYTVVLGIFFLACQVFEYNIALFTIQDSCYGSAFYMLTGLHGFHVYVGMTALAGCYFSRYNAPLKMYGHRTALDGSIWYWHFVDVVWLFLFVVIYWWGGESFS